MNNGISCLQFYTTECCSSQILTFQTHLAEMKYIRLQQLYGEYFQLIFQFLFHQTRKLSKVSCVQFTLRDERHCFSLCSYLKILNKVRIFKYWFKLSSYINLKLMDSIIDMIFYGPLWYGHDLMWRLPSFSPFAAYKIENHT